MAAELAGVRVRAIYRLREREPGFSERMAEAVAKANARLDEQGHCPHPPAAPQSGRGVRAAPA